MDALTAGAKGGGGPGGPVPPIGPGQMPQFPPPPSITPPGTTLGGGGGTPWYLNPQTLGLLGQGVGAIWGAYNQNQTNNQNLDAQKAQLALLNARQGQVTDYVNAFLQPGQSPYSAAILQMLGAQSQAPAAQTPGQPASQLPAAPQPGAGGSVPPVGSSGWSIFNPALRTSLVPTGGPQMPQTGQFAAPQGANDVNPSIPVQQPQIGQYGTQGGFSLPGFTAPGQITPGTYNPAAIDLAGFSAGTSGFNAGQDALMQMLRAGPALGADPQVAAGISGIISGGGNTYDNSGLFSAIDAQGQSALEQQLADLSGSYGSFGRRLGSSAMNAQSKLRSNYLLGSNLQKQQIGAQSYADAQNRLFAALGLGAQQQNVGNQNALAAYGAQAGVGQGLAGLGLSQSQLLAQIAQSNQGAYNTGAQFNISNSLAAQQANQSAGQQYNQFQLGALGQANAIQQAQSGQNINLLSLLAGLPMGQAPVAQPNALPGAIGDISQLALLYPYLRRG